MAEETTALPARAAPDARNTLAGFFPRTARESLLRLFQVVEGVRIDVELPDGGRTTVGPVSAPRRTQARIHRDDFFRRVILSGEIGVGEAWMAGDWWAEDLPLVLEHFARARSRLEFSGPLALIGRMIESIRHQRNANSRSGSDRNIRAHYDLGNDFYRLMLDDTMSYSSAWFESADMTLPEAQAVKNRRIIRELGLTSEHHLLEIGCGWGGFALQAARETGCRVTGITLSREQHAWAGRKVMEAGLADRIAIRSLDYRDLSGRFDRIASIEMFEAVGHEYYDTYFDAVRRVLAPGGRMVMQAITIPDAQFPAYRRGSDWIRKHVFPGSLLASVSEVSASLERVGGLSISRCEEMGDHYPPTLEAWRTAFHDRLDDVRALGFDDTFIRMWDYYLASCIAGFRAGVIGNVQLTLQRS